MPARMFSTPSRRVTSPLKRDYQARLSKGTVRPDQRQAALVDALGSMLKQLSASVKKIGGKTKTQGAYVFGPVCVHHSNLVPSTWVVQFCSVVPGCSCFPSSALVFPCCHRLSGSPPPAHILKIVFPFGKLFFHLENFFHCLGACHSCGRLRCACCAGRERQEHGGQHGVRGRVPGPLLARSYAPCDFP